MLLHRTFIQSSDFALASKSHLNRAFHCTVICQQEPCLPYQSHGEIKNSSFPRKTTSTSTSNSSSIISHNRIPFKRISSNYKAAQSPKTQARSQLTMATKSSEAEQDTYTQAFTANSKWRGNMATSHPELFEQMSKGQSPQILWIGCSDSRCPETTILGLQPGDVFVHRNIANILTPTDLNSLSVIQYAVQYLQVKHVVLCGHTSCGGVAAALGNKKLGLIDTWLMPLRTLRRDNLELLDGMEEKERGLKLVELNVRRGVEVLTENPVVLEAINERGLKVHGLIYDVGSGELNELDVEASDEVVNSRKTAFHTQ